jgi:hypothetical protein
VPGFLFQADTMSEQPETESLSIEDRLLAQFEPEQPEVEAAPEQPEVEAQAEAEESEAQPEFQEIEYEGKTYQVPPELKDAILRQSDYTKKTTEVSERQRAIEQKELQIRAAETERQFHETVKGDVAQVQKIDFQIEQWKAVDVTGLSSEQLWKVSREIDQLKEKRAELTNGINSKWQGFQHQQQQLAQEARAKAEEHISKAIKGWGPDTHKSIREYALAEGFTTPELDAIADPRVVKVLWAASQFNKLQAQTIQGKVKSAPVVKPGSSNPMPQHVKDNFAYKKQMSSAKTSAEKAAIIQKRLESQF